MDKKYNVDMFDVGVNVARFQLPDLHDAHVELINIMLETHKRLIIVLGLAALKCTPKDPLNFAMRKQAFIDKFGDHMGRIKLLYLNDERDDKDWSDSLDALIKKNTKSIETIRYCGGRDSFLKYYTNKVYEHWEIKDFVQNEFISATQIRNDIAATTEFTSEFRRGVVYAAHNILPPVFCAVDVAIFNQNNTHILMGKRVGESTYRFMGAWLQMGETNEVACRRAVKEKASVDIYSLVPLKSFTGHDWKFKGQKVSLVSMLYSAHIGDVEKPEPKGNFYALRWVPFNEVINVVDMEHLEMAKYIFGRK